MNKFVSSTGSSRTSRRAQFHRDQERLAGIKRRVDELNKQSAEGQRCPLCASGASIEWRPAERHYSVICPQCVRYTLDAYLLDLFRAECRARESRMLGVLRRLSRAAQDTVTAGGWLHLSGDNWALVAREAHERD